jgi:hypothetical protein
MGFDLGQPRLDLGQKFDRRLDDGTLLAADHGAVGQQGRVGRGAGRRAGAVRRRRGSCGAPPLKGAL